MRASIDDQLRDERFAKAKAGSKQDQLGLLRQRWWYLNFRYFGGRLREPNIYFIRDTGPRFRRHGCWKPSVRKIGITRRIFNSDAKHLDGLMLHEMCHQAVSELDRKTGEKPHGPEWSQWMRKVGLEPTPRASENEHLSLLAKEEKKKVKVWEKYVFSLTSLLQYLAEDWGKLNTEAFKRDEAQFYLAFPQKQKEFITLYEQMEFQVLDPEFFGKPDYEGLMDAIMEIARWAQDHQEAGYLE